jgi:hypothetical protein
VISAAPERISENLEMLLYYSWVYAGGNANMPGLLIGKIVVILLFLLVFYFGVAGLKSGEIRSRGHKLNRDDDPIGYWFTVLVSLVGPVAIIYLLLTR